jgi:hypothetical protein
MLRERLARPARTALFRMWADRVGEWAVDDGTIGELISTFMGWSAMIVGELDGKFFWGRALAIAACG